MSGVSVCAAMLAVPASAAEQVIAPAPMQVSVNGQTLDLSQAPAAPYEKDGQMMVPLWLTAQALGYTVTWEPEQEGVTEKGATMRLGAYPCRVLPETLAAEAYGEPLVYERHRHRYEVNNAYREQLEAAGLRVSGISPDGRLVEMVELPEDVHPWFVASQAHPEFKSRPDRPAPLFREFVRAAIAHHEGCGRHEVMPPAAPTAPTA